MKIAAIVVLAGCGTSASHSGQADTHMRTRAATSTDAPASKPGYIAKADAICARTASALTPVQNNLYVDQARVSASLSADTLANRRRVANDFKQVVVAYQQKQAALSVLRAPAADRAILGRYLSAAELQTALIRKLITAYDLPSGATISDQHLSALAEQLVIGRQLLAAQTAGQAAAHAYGFHVCGSGH
jgi:hypothetical protein